MVMRQAVLVAVATALCTVALVGATRYVAVSEARAERPAVHERDVAIVHEVLSHIQKFVGNDISVYGHIVSTKSSDGSVLYWLVPFPELIEADVGDTMSQLALAIRFAHDWERDAASACVGGFGRVRGEIALHGSAGSIIVSKPTHGIVVFEGRKFRLCK